MRRLGRRPLSRPRQCLTLAVALQFALCKVVSVTLPECSCDLGAGSAPNVFLLFLHSLPEAFVCLKHLKKKILSIITSMSKWPAPAGKLVPRSGGTLWSEPFNSQLGVCPCDLLSVLSASFSLVVLVAQHRFSSVPPTLFSS